MKKILFPVLTFTIFSWGISANAEEATKENPDSVQPTEQKETTPSSNINLEIIGEECHCSGVSDDNSQPLLRRLISTSDVEAAKFKERTTKSLIQQLEIITQFSDPNALIDLEAMKYVTFVQALKQIIYYMDKDAPLYNELHPLYIRLKPFESQISEEKQKTDLIEKITENYFKIMDIIAKISQDPGTYARTNCVCKEKIKDQIHDLELNLQKADSKVAEFKEMAVLEKEGTDISKLNDYLDLLKDARNILINVAQNLLPIINSPQEKELLSKLFDYLSTLVPVRVSTYEQFEAESAELLNTYGEKQTIMGIIDQVKKALSVSDKEAEDHYLRHQYFYLIKEYKKVGETLDTLGVMLGAKNATEEADAKNASEFLSPAAENAKAAPAA